VYVAPESRRHGVAPALVVAAIDAGRRRGLARIRLHATPEGRSVYERLGFTRRDDEMELVL
jgi:GNAT superfamily N-acetyltransferase